MKVVPRWERAANGERDTGFLILCGQQSWFSVSLFHVCFLGLHRRQDSRELPWSYGFYCYSTTARRSQLSLFPVEKV